MALWFYQLSANEQTENHWPVRRYRLDIWEGENWHFSGGRIQYAGNPARRPEPGDQVVFCYAPSFCEEPGFYGWAVVTPGRQNLRIASTSGPYLPVIN
jgi:hypothetical protein